MELSLFNQIFLATFYTVVALFYTLRIKLFQPQEPCGQLVHMGRRGSLHWWNHLTFRIFRILIWAVCVWRLFWPELDAYLLFVPVAELPMAVSLGMGLMVVGFALAIWGNLTLDSLWRSGVDQEAPSQLVTHSLYRYSRNPIFIGVLTGQLGFFMALPGWFSLVCLLVGWTAIGVQVRLEEAHLAAKYPREFNAYCQQTARWFGRGVASD